MKLNRTLKRYASRLVLTVVLGLVCLFCIFAMPGIVGADHSFVVLSGSMSPAINPGDVIIVESTDPGAIKQNDIITYTRGQEQTPTTHRVVDIQHTNGNIAFETKGDANEQPDQQLVFATDVIGTVMFSIPYLGYVISFANTTIGVITLIVIPMGLLVGTELHAAILTDRSDKRDKPNSQSHSHANVHSNTDTNASSPETVPGSESEATDAQFTLGSGDLIIPTVLLLLFVPYTWYVALTLQTILSFSVAFGTCFLLLSAGGLWVVTRRPLTNSRVHRWTNTETQSDRVPTNEDAIKEEN